MSSKTLKITYTGDAKGVLGAINQIDQAHASFGDRLKKTGASITSAGKSMTAGLTLPIVGFGIAAVKSFTDAEKVTAQTGAAIKSTGGAANVTAKEVGQLATQIQNYSGMSDEAVAQGENLLLTFTNIRNEAGKGNDIFTQSTKVLADMSVAMGTDMTSSAVQLGKALNDPVAGITALTRVGVTFDEQTKKQIETLVKQGDTLEAQKIILAELNKEFGGSAKAAGETASGAFAIAREKIGNSMEKIGKAIVEVGGPILDQLASGLQKGLKWFNSLNDGTKETIVKVAALVAAIGPALIIIGKLTSAVGSLANVVGKMGFLLTPGGLFLAGLALMAAGFVQAELDAQQLERASTTLSKAFLKQSSSVEEVTRVLESKGLPAFAETAIKEDLIAEASRKATAVLFDQSLAFVKAGGQASKFADEIFNANELTITQRETVGRALETLDEFGIVMGDTATATLQAYLKTGNYDNAIKLLRLQLQPTLGAMKNMLSYTQSAAEAAADAAQQYRGLADAFGDVGSSGGGGGGGKKYPPGFGGQLASGGIVTRPTHALIGEAGPEAVIPLNRAGSLGTNVYVTVEGSVIREAELAETIRRQLIRTGDRNGDIFGGRA